MQTRIPKMAEDLKRFVQAYKYGEWISYVTQDFNFQNFMKGLEWFSGSDCHGCLKGGGMPTCEVRICCKARGLRNCYFCEDFLKCGKLDYQREAYRIDRDHKRVKQIGYRKWMKEQEGKRKRDFDNIWFLEKKVSK
jgi:hypothetical protein